MTIDDKVRNEKLMYKINREATKMSALSTGENDKYEHLADEEILFFNQRQIIEQDKFTYFPLQKVFEKQSRTTEEQRTNE